jgi:hypothetical protein
MTEHSEPYVHLEETMKRTRIPNGHLNGWMTQLFCLDVMISLAMS